LFLSFALQEFKHAKLRQQPHEAIGKQARNEKITRKERSEKWVSVPISLVAAFCSLHSSTHNVLRFLSRLLSCLEL
jgi:hypothetical protein